MRVRGGGGCARSRLTPSVQPYRHPLVSPSPDVVPAPTIRTMIRCLPDEVPGEVFDRRLLDRYFGVQGSIVTRFWAKPCNPWRRRHLVDARKGTPTACAGGPLRLL